MIDTGVDYEHPDLNVVGGVDCSGGGPFGGSCSSGGDDDHYHGIHVAGTVGALDNGSGVVGVAPGARIWAVKVLDSRGSGYESWIVAGIDWVAAGNSNDDTINYSPGGFDNVLSVSALADFSNWGSAVDIAAPGVCILSTYPIEQGEYASISGTSMASPHVAGALALLASQNNPSNATDVYNLYDDVVNAGNFNWTDDSGDGILEPLLDVSTFGATLIATDGGGGGDDGGGDTGGSFTLDATGYKVKGVRTADLTWGGTTATNVDIYVDGALVDTTANDGAYTYSTGQKGGGSATFTVCEVGTTTCSNDATVNW